MAIRWTPLKNRILRVLDDTERSRPTYSDEELMDYVNSGLTTLASVHTAQECEYIITTPKVENKLVMPENFLALGPVYYQVHGRRVMLQPLKLHPGESIPALIGWLAPQPVMWNSHSYGNISFYEYPAGTLNFSLPVIEGLEMHANYFGYYDRVEAETDIILAPRWAEEALIWYVQMLAMAKPSVQASMLGQYKTKIDAGSPEDNPLLKSVEHCRKMWERILSSNDKQARTGWEAQ